MHNIFQYAEAFTVLFVWHTAEVTRVRGLQSENQLLWIRHVDLGMTILMGSRDMIFCLKFVNLSRFVLLLMCKLSCQARTFTSIWSRPKKNSGGYFSYPIHLTKSATLNKVLHCSLWQFSEALFYFRGLFAFRGWNRPEPPCNFFPEFWSAVFSSAVVEDRFLCRHVGSNFIPTATFVNKTMVRK